MLRQILSIIHVAYPILICNGFRENLHHKTKFFFKNGTCKIIKIILLNVENANGPIEWPARSPDLTPMDFLLWVYLKSKVYKDKPQNLEDLKFKIRYEIRHINENTINNVLEGFLRRLAYCQEANGWHFQHLIK